MVDFFVRTTGKDYNCDVHVEGDIPQRATVTLSGCDLHVDRQELDYMEAEEGMTTEFRIYDLPPDEEPGRFDKRLKKVGGESLGSVSVLWMGSSYDMRINHFKIDESAEGQGLGTTMLLIVFGLAELAEVDDIHFWIGGGEDTIEWLVSKGVPRGSIDTTTTGNASFTVDFSEIEYNTSRVSVSRH